MKKPLAIALMITLGAACEKSPSSVSDPWPADGRMPALGSYDYTFSWSDASAGSETYKGTLTITAETPTTLTVSWSLPEYRDPTAVAWNGETYHTYVWRRSVQFHHDFWRENGEKKLSCVGQYIYTSGAGVITYPATCQLTYNGP